MYLGSISVDLDEAGVYCDFEMEGMDYVLTCHPWESYSYDSYSYDYYDSYSYDYDYEDWDDYDYYPDYDSYSCDDYGFADSAGDGCGWYEDYPDSCEFYENSWGDVAADCCSVCGAGEVTMCDL